jgi:hypothetical protein
MLIAIPGTNTLVANIITGQLSSGQPRKGYWMRHAVFRLECVVRSMMLLITRWHGVSGSLSCLANLYSKYVQSKQPAEKLLDVQKPIGLPGSKALHFLATSVNTGASPHEALPVLS